MLFTENLKRALPLSPSNPQAWLRPISSALAGNTNQPVRLTGEVLTNLFATLGDIHSLMRGMALIAQIIALGAVILASMFAVALRRDTLDLLRTLGAPRSFLMLSV